MSDQSDKLFGLAGEFDNNISYPKSMETRQYISSTLILAGKEIESLEKENAALMEAQRWIPVSERLPEDGIEVLVYESEDSSIYSACKWYDEWNGFPGERITHWMHLPPPPTTDKGE